MRVRNFAFYSLSVFLLAGCSAISSKFTQPSSDIAAVWINQTAGIDILEAYSNQSQLYLKYRAFLKASNQSRIFYAKTSWGEASEVDLSKNIVVSLEFIDESLWLTRPENLQQVKDFDFNRWKKFRTKLAHDLTPDQSYEGVVVRSDEAELFLYYDKDNNLTVVDVKDKPADVAITRTYSQNELSEYTLNSLKEYLHSNGYQEQVVLFVTDDEKYVNPFIYADLNHNVVINLAVGTETKNAYKEGVFKKGVKTADYFIVDSHLLGLLKRPFSSSYRLFSWTKDATYDVVNPDKIVLMETSPIVGLNQGETMDLQEFEEYLDKTVKSKLSTGEINFLIGGDEFFPRLIDSFIKAKKSIDVRIFIFDNDDYGVKIADVLKGKSKENVDVKVLLDGMGVIMGEGKVAETLPAGFIPPPTMKQYLVEDSEIQVRIGSNAWFKADHIKTIVVDNDVLYTGGMNIGREYRYNWHDMMMEVKGPIIAEIADDFNKAWAHSSSFGDIGYVASVIKSKKPDIQGNGYPIRLLYTSANNPQIYRAQLAAIRKAKKYIYIHNAYFSDNTVLYELIKARRRGVDVRVVLPVSGNHEIMNDSNAVTANIMFKNGIRVFFYPGMSHIKAAIYDGWLCTGSANFDKLSLKDNLELNLATSHSETVQELEKLLFEPDFQKAAEMTEPIEIGLKERFAEFFAGQL